MKEILTRLQEFEYIKMVVFSEEVILKVHFEIETVVAAILLWILLGSGWELANLWLFGIISLERIPIGKSYTICATTKALCDK